MHIDVPWGAGNVTIEVDDTRVAGILGARVEAASDPDGVLRAALASPGGSISDFLSTAPPPLLVVVNDATRPTPSADVLRVIRPHLEQWLQIQGRMLSFAVATGTHRAALAEELDHIFGSDLVRDHGARIFSHDAKAAGDMVALGRTIRGTDVKVNRLLAEAESVVIINSVEPHYFAGYTGGRKSLFPGLAAYDTVWANHSLSMRPGAESLVLAGNPVHEDLEEALAMGIAGKEVFSIQLVLDKEHRIGFAACGSLADTFHRALSVADRQFVLDLEQRYDVVVAVAPYPMDCNLYQTNKAIQSGALAVKDGGVLIVVSQCPFGLGENQTLFDMLSAADSPRAAAVRACEEDYRLGVQQAARIATILDRIDIWMVTTLRDDDVRAIFMIPWAELQKAVEAALERQGPEAQVLFLMEASITVPRVSGKP